MLTPYTSKSGQFHQEISVYRTPPYIRRFNFCSVSLFTLIRRFSAISSNLYLFS